MTFFASAAKRVLDPREWLPSYGESGIKFRSDGLDVVVEILYESDGGDAALVKRELRFIDVCSFYKSAFPGPALPNSISYDGAGIAPILGSLIQFEKSSVADAWRSHFSGNREVKHFVMQFLAENVEIEVFAAGYLISEELSA